MEYRPLTSSQKLFWGNSKFFTNSMWNIGYYIQMGNQYSVERINDVLNEFLMKNEGTRLQIMVKEGIPYSYIAEYQKCNFAVKTFYSEEEFNKFRNEEINKEFVVDSNLCKAFICCINGEYGVLFVSHHILCDGGSLLSLKTIADALQNDNEIQSSFYTRHIDEELQYKVSKRYNIDKEFWSQAFKAFPNCALYTKNDCSFNYESKESLFSISKDCAAKIRDYCSNNKVSTHAFFDTSFGMYFNMNTNSKPFTVGIPISWRTNRDDKNTFGLYTQVVPLIIDFESSSFKTNIAKVNDTLLTDFRHLKYSVSELSEEILNGQKVYDVVVEYHVLPFGDRDKFSTYYSNKLATALEIHIEDCLEDKISVLIRYREQFFNDNDIQTMFKSVMKIIETAIDDRFDFSLNDKENNIQTTALSVLEGEIVEIPNCNVFDLFLKNAEKNSNEICIKSKEKNLTYKEFVMLVRKLIFKIKQYSFTPNDKVIIIAQRSVEMYTAIYAAMGVGCCFVPIDPFCPTERISYIIKDTSAKIALIQNRNLINDNNLDDLQLIFVDECLEEENCGLDEEVKSPACSEDTAYIMYTSGTTGIPKGVMISHRSLINRIQWMNRVYPLEKNDVILQKTPYTFDVSLWEIFLWGLYGGAMSILPPKDHYNMSKIINVIYDDKITYIHFVPSVYKIFIDYLNSNPLELQKIKSLRHIFLSGESLPMKYVQKVSLLVPWVEQHNLYGPTECAIDVTFFDFKECEESVTPIGAPIDNTYIYIVDEEFKLVAQGEKGELCIGGANVGKGYLNKQELTMEKFVVNPFGNGKIYRSGDIAYVNENQKLVFCGRKDDQIKLFGQRIELGEIENAFLQLSFVEKTAVFVDSNSDRQQIVAFYTGEYRENSEIVNLLKEKIQAYMIPTIIQYIESIPLTQHGKVDKKQLEKIITIDNKKEISRPESKLEKDICKLFSKQLGVEILSRDESFFDVGASSIDVVSILSSDLLKDLSIDEFCQHPTPSSLAKYLTEERTITHELIPMSISKSEELVFVLFPYAGGNMISYNVFVKKIRERFKDASFYYLGWNVDVEKASKEIVTLFADKKIVFYSHCAGAALAIKIIEEIDRLTNRGLAIYYFAGGLIPPDKRKPIINMWKFTPNFLVKKLLLKAGIEKSITDLPTFDLIIEQFRNNTDYYFDFVKTHVGKICHPVTVILADNDLFTRKINSASKVWAEYVSGALNTEIIKSNSHYFLSDPGSNLFDVICECIIKKDDKI